MTLGSTFVDIVGTRHIDLIEVPALVALVYVVLWLRPRLFPAGQQAE